MTDENYDPTKPKWDSSQDGALPEELSDEFANSAKIAKAQEKEWEELEKLTPEQRLDRLDAIQTEATNLANSWGAGEMTPEQQFIVQQQHEATVAASQLLVFQNPNNKVDDRESKVRDCRRALATALYKLGKLDDALAIASPFPELVTYIQALQIAISKPDEDLQNHSCERLQSEQDGKPIELDRHSVIEEIFSLRHGKKVYVWQCGICFELNACAEKPERQVKYDSTMLATIHKLAKGDQPNAKGILISPKLQQFEAATILAKES
jgi:hypothetical protein